MKRHYWHLGNILFLFSQGRCIYLLLEIQEPLSTLLRPVPCSASLTASPRCPWLQLLTWSVNRRNWQEVGGFQGEGWGITCQTTGFQRPWLSLRAHLPVGDPSSMTRLSLDVSITLAAAASWSRDPGFPSFFPPASSESFGVQSISSLLQESCVWFILKIRVKPKR